MARGAPVVSTTIGAEGLPVLNEEHLLIADTPDVQAVAHKLARACFHIKREGVPFDGARAF